MTLPLLISLPHAGLRVPDEVSELCKLTANEIMEDGDVGAAEIYDLANQVKEFVSTDVARAIVDMNRAHDDRRADGVVKTHTCWNLPVYHEPPPEEIVQELLKKYYHPYHDRLRKSALPSVVAGIDCHTMAAYGPPIGPDPGQERPQVCLSNADGTCPEKWLESLALTFGRYFKTVTKNIPFRGGFVVRSHASELPWVQLELSRDPFIPDSEKRSRVLAALREWCNSTLP